MLLRLASHLHAETILEGAFRREWDELRDVLARIDPPLRPAQPFTVAGRPATPKRQSRTIAGRRAFALYPVDQPGLNSAIDRQLRDLEWAAQPLAVGAVDGVRATGLTGDFQRNGVFVEVEFGNVASMFRDLFKFQIAGQARVGEVGVLIVASSHVAAFFDQGVATFEQARNLLPYMRIGLSLPVAIVGLDLNDWSRLRRRYDEMREVAEANGLDCHPFESIMREAPSQMTLDD